MRNKKNKAKSRLNEKEFKDYVLTFFNKQRRYKKSEEDYKILRNTFYEMAEDYFVQNGLENQVVIYYDCYAESNEVIKVSRIRRTNVEFNIRKLEKTLDKEILKDIIEKEYIVNDMNGLISYLKECKVDPNIFKTFLTVNKKVNEKKLDNLYDLGKIKKEEIEDCYKVEKSKPFFKVSLEKKKGNE